MDNCWGTTAFYLVTNQLIKPYILELYLYMVTFSDFQLLVLEWKDAHALSCSLAHPVPAEAHWRVLPTTASSRPSPHCSAAQHQELCAPGTDQQGVKVIVLGP